MFTKFSLKDYNFKLLASIIVIIAIGSVFVNSADSDYTTRQIIGAVASIFLIIFISTINYDFICKFFMAYYIINAVLLLMVLIAGEEVNHATRWIKIGGENGVQFQPSELTKIFMIIFMACFLDRHKDEINTIKVLLMYAAFAAIPMFLIFKEPDLSTTLCLTLILVTLIYVAGLSYKLIGIIMLIIIPVAGSFIWYIQRPDQHLLKDYQVGRILSFIYPGKYGDNMSQQNNSIMAIGSGMLHGKGLNSSTIATVKDANFISEQQTDFIFSVIGEEVGFIGSVIIIAIMLIIVLQCIKIARTAKDTKGMLIVTGITALIAFQTFINIGVATGVLPNTGIPLPFVSYGLSSLMSVSIGMGMVLNVSLQRTRF